MQTKTQELLAAYYATRPGFQGKVTRQAIGGKQARRQGKAQLIKKASRI